MALFRSERGIGRGEIAESRVEAPFFVVFMVICAIALLIFHMFVQNESITIALAVSMIVFGLTVLRVDLGIYILVIAMLLSPEIETGSVGQFSERSVNLRYDDILIAVIFFGVLVKLAFEGNLQLWRPNPINIGIVAYFGVCIIANFSALRVSVGAWDRNVAFFVTLKMAEFYMIFFMVGNAINSSREIRKQLTLFLIVAMIVCLYAIYSVGVIDRVSAPFEKGGTEPNTLGGYLTIVICISLGLFLNAPSRNKKIIFTYLMIIAIIPFLYTLSRASYLALIVALLAIGFMGRRLSIVLIVTLVLVFSPKFMPSEVKDRVNYTFQRGTGEPVTIMGYSTGLQVDKSTHERIYVWQKVKYNLRVWPWFGGGISWDNVLDSQYARVLIETGLFGIITFVFLLWQILKVTRETYHWSNDWFNRGMALGAFGTLIGLIVHGMGTISFLIVRIMEPFWFIIALTVVARSIAIEEYRQRHHIDMDDESEEDGEPSTEIQTDAHPITT